MRLFVLLIALGCGAASAAPQHPIDAAPGSAWAAFLPSPAAQPILAALGLDGLPPEGVAAVGATLERAGAAVPDAAAPQSPAAQAAALRAKMEAYAEDVRASRAPMDETTSKAFFLLSLGHAHSLAQAQALSERSIAQAREAWNDKPLSLSHVAAVMERRLASGQAASEDAYRAMDPAAFFAGSETRRMDTLLTRQAADPAQAMLEVIANGQDASLSGGNKVGRFGVGGLQVLGELKAPEDRVVMETSKGEGRAARFTFWRKDGEIFFDYRLVDSKRKGTMFQVVKKFTAEEVAHRREFLERKLRANDRGPIVWRSGGRINHPEEFREWGADGPLAMGPAAAVAVSLDESGYEIQDSGRGMGLKEVFERYLKPYGTDKPVAASNDPARLLYRDADESLSRTSLGVASVEIEKVPSASKRLNLAGDVFIDLPHDTELTEERGVVSLVTANQSISGAIRGMRLLIERLTDPKTADPARVPLLNSLAALIREKQPAREKGVIRGEPATATDLLWYLRHRLHDSGILQKLREQGLALLPNTAKWAPLQGVSDKIVFLDDALFSPSASDFAAAGFERAPPALTAHPAWQALKARAQAEFFVRDLARGGPLAVVEDGVIVVDKSLTKGSEDPEVLIARIEREIRHAPKAAPPKPAQGRLRRALGRILRPAVLALALAAVPVAYHYVSAALPKTDPSSEWMPYESSHIESNGNFPKLQQGGAAVQNAQPQWPFGVYETKADVDPHFIESIRTRLQSDGAWAPWEGQWDDAAADPGQVAGTAQVRYRIGVHKLDYQRLFNQANGRIVPESIHVTNARGKDLAYTFDPRMDALIVPDYEGPAMVSYTIELRQGVNAVQGTDPLPDNETSDLPAKWRQELVPVMKASDERKVAAIEKIMARDMVYDYSKPYARDDQSWMHTAQAYLDRGEPIPIICNTSSLYYFIMARYVGLPAAYMGLVSTQNDVFYHDLAGHARVMIQVDGRWRVVETTALMPLKVAAPRVLAGPNGPGRPGHGWGIGSDSGSGSSIGSRLDPRDYPAVAVAVLGMLAFLGTFLWRAAKGLVLLWRRRRGLAGLRQAWSLFGSLRQRLPLSWIPWRTLGRPGEKQSLAAPWGALYRNAADTNRFYISDAAGAMQSLRLQSEEPYFVGRHLVFASASAWPHKSSWLRTFDGSKFKTIYQSFWWTPTLLEPVGGRIYAAIGRHVVRIDPETGRTERVMDIGRSVWGRSFAVLESRGGVDRFAVIRRSGWGKTRARTFAVSGNRGRWEGPEQIIPAAFHTRHQWFAWATPKGTVYEIVNKEGKIKRRTVFWSGAGVIAAPGPVQTVLGGRIFAFEGTGLKAYDPATRRWDDAEIAGRKVADIKEAGPDLFSVSAVEDGKSRPFFCDSDGQLVAEGGLGAVRAVRVGETVYFRRGGDFESLHAATRDGQSRKLSLAYTPHALYSQAAARAAGLDAKLFAPLDGDWKRWPGELFVADPKRAERASADAEAVSRLAPELSAAAPYRAAMMPRWALFRHFLSPQAARHPIPESLEKRLDELVRKNQDRQDWLREVFELVDRIYRQGAPGGRSAAVGHYLDMLEAVPEILGDLREALLSPVALEGGARVEPLAYLENFSPKTAQGLPAVTQLYLQLLKDGAESLLRREKDDAPQGPPAFTVEEAGSLSRLIAAANKLPNDAVDTGGLRGFSGALSALAPGEQADLAAVRGVVVNQGLSAPVWIRELVQNARDAVRETRRLGREVSSDIALRSYLSEDGSRWIVSVRDGVGMKLSRFLKALLVPEATSKTLADEVRGFLSLGGGIEEKAARLLEEFFDDAAKTDQNLLAFLRGALRGDDASAARAISEKLSQRMKKGGAGFFGIGFFTVFGGADEVIVRTGADGRLREATLVPQRDENGRLTDISVKWVRDYDDPEGGRRGTEILRVKTATPQNIGKILVENAYVHIMAAKYAGAVSDVGLSLNGQSIRDGLDTVGEKDGLRSRLGQAGQPRWTVDELFVQEPAAEGLALIPEEIRGALRAAGWNLDFPAATPVVRTRASVQGPERFAAAAAELALPAAYRLYRERRLTLPGQPAFAQRRRTSPWDNPPIAPDVRRDAETIASGAGSAALFGRYAADPRRWAQLMLAVRDDQERSLRAVLGPRLSAALDEIRDRGLPLRVGPLPAEDAPDFAAQVRALHEAALAKARDGGTEFADEPAAAGLSRVLTRLSSLIDQPPPFVPAGPKLWEAMRRCLDEGLAVPLMEALLEACGRTSDDSAVALFEGWLKTGAAKKELQSLFLGSASRSQAEESLDRMWKRASRDRPPIVGLRRPS